METALYNLEGKKAGTVNLPENIFGVKWNADLVKQVADSLLSSKRKNIAHTKTRGKVRGGGRKPWKQKGTGRARHGSIRSPLWRHGGVAHGPRTDKNYERKVGKTMRIKALHTILSRKLHDGEVLFVDALTMPQAKTKQAIKTLNAFSDFKIMSKKKNAAAIALGSKNKETERAFRNLSNVEVLEARNLNPLTLLQYKYIILENPEISLKALPKIKNAKS
ncbi:MAG: 50S ribosomal protein L4 [Candidatus Zambryskibacteria bacterium]|nr:50S ribosomal protein L4 [Candidatus Zambryskibacteria bacterium]